MTSPALASLTNPSTAPAAALGRLLVSSGTLLAESRLASAGPYAGSLAKLSAVAGRVAQLLEAALAGNAAGQDMAGIANTERLAKAYAALFGELARRQTRRERVVAMGWATLASRVLSDSALTAREHAAGVYLGTSWSDAMARAPIRILPGADPALVELARDPLLSGADWDTVALAASLARWVTVT